MNFMIYFWAFFAYGMTFGLPLIIHYTSYASGMWKDVEPSQSPGMAFFLLGLGCVLWVVLFVWFGKKFFFSQFKKKAQGERLLREGKKVNGSIVGNKRLVSSNGRESLLLKVAFKNLVGANVTAQLDIVDTEPELRRFESGHSVPLVIDPALGNPAIMIAGKRFGWNKPVMIIVVIGLLLIIGNACFYLISGYLYESRGYGWRFLEFWHPFILTPLMACFIMFVFTVTIGKYMSKPPNLSKLTLYGQSAEASVVSASRTGLSINEQPQVMITVDFVDSRGRAYQSSFKKIIDLLDLGSITVGNKINILYDPAHPTVVEPIW